MRQSSDRRRGALSEPNVEAPEELASGGREHGPFTSLAQKTYEALRAALLNGEFRAGQTISLRSAAEALGVGQMPVRHALSRLQAEGIFVMQPNRSLAVPTATRTSIIEIRDVRIALEGLAAEQAAQRATQREIDELAGHFEVMKQVVQSSDIKRYIAVNLKFHMTLYRAGRSATLFQLIESIWVKSSANSRLVAVEEAVGTLPNHARALEGVRSRDPIMARAAIVQDCCATYEIQLALLAASDAEASNGSPSNVAHLVRKRTLPAGALGSLVGSKRRGRPPKAQT
ncbi:GntR family transcriptional regulator [Methylocapsa sp. S129]|uniref:GntR family transcriptional regulator n=1 Tax=Methylocapsa sp. S129 TaxID=1641869 RepID=UPI00131D7030|nr:GntR family transcriptional regulator [Methylocapsa sp. S129]